MEMRSKIKFFKILSGVIISVIGIIKLQNRYLDRIYRERKIANRNHALYLMMNSWLILEQKRKSFAEYFQNHNYNKIAIYGMSNMGERLYDELLGSNIKIEYGIDKNAKRIFTDLKIYEPRDELKEVDVIVVTAINYFDDIRDELSKKINCPIISIKEIIDEIFLSL